jgi:hypothetical protein
MVTQESIMKRLKVKWVPEICATISLTVAVPHEIVLNRLPTLRNAETSAPCTRLIVISGGTELKADVTAVQQCAA